MKSVLRDFSSIKHSLAKGEINCDALVQSFVKRIHKASQLNAFITLLEESARRRAREIDHRYPLQQSGKLAGMVLAIKDIIVTTDGHTTCASNMLRNFTSPYQATVVHRLEAADAIIIGKTNMDEFGMGSSSENSAFGPVRNPYDVQRVAGGSSGGSAAAVAAGLCTAALGSDTGGSIRQPAAFCGVVGLKPTYGRVSRYGLIAYASSLDQIGPICHTAADCAEILQVIAGRDDNDATSLDMPVPDYASFLQQDVRGLRIGVPKEFFAAGLETSVRQAVEESIQFLQQSGAEIREITLPHTPYAIAAYYIIATAEASANLARFDGGRYGYRAQPATDLNEMYVRSRSQGFGAEVQRRIMLGTFVLSSGYYDAYYGQAQKVRTLIKEDFLRAFADNDLLLGPTCPTTAFALGEKLADPLTMYLSDVFTVAVNLAGVPALSLPCGKDQRGLPIGLQLIAGYFQEGMLLRVADFLQRCYAPSSPAEYVPQAWAWNAQEVNG